jgi:hypothetical protein
MEKQPKNELNIELSEEKADGIYSNLVLISHSPSEFVYDFIRVVPGMPKAKVHSRIIMAPQHAKGFLKALSDNIGKYESQFGEILPIGQNQSGPNNFSFKPSDFN